MEVDLYRVVMTKFHHGGSFIQDSTDHCSHHGGRFIQGSYDHCSQAEAVLYREVKATVPTKEVSVIKAVPITVLYTMVCYNKAVLATVPQIEEAV